MNAYNFWMQFIWMAEGDQPYGVGTGSDAVGSYSNVATMLANCTLSFYNVTVDYRNGSYSLLHEELSNVGLSDGLALPARLGHLNSNLISNIEGRVFTDNSMESVMAFLRQDFARLALGSAAVIANETTDTLLQGTLNNMIVGRYPLWPILIFVGLMYTHASLALILFLVTALPMRTRSLAVTTRRGDSSNRISVLQLTQMRLHGPLPLVSTLFPSSHAEADQATLSIKTDELDMFDEKSNEGRLVAGLHSEGHFGQTQFGVHMVPFSDFDDSVIESKLRSATGYRYVY
ncbi:hypothetical protein QCA50_007295 [Cerrena zonata]|uniref:Uncharacterized protein n=1 Tax=Cerrena zonata TaxID=2478898 RepID=A0AAW0G7Y6_9APHY